MGTVLEIVTKQDLQELKVDLISEIKLIIECMKPEQPKQWLRSADVRKMLNISPGTLQQLRITRALKYNMVGKIIYYKLQNVVDLMERGMNGE